MKTPTEFGLVGLGMANPMIYPRSSRRSRAALLVLLTLWLAWGARVGLAQEPVVKRADVLVFTNGDQLTGTLIGAVGDAVTFKSDMAGEVKVPLGKIKELRSGSPFAVLRKDQPPTKVPAKVGTIAISDGKFTVARSPGEVELIPSEQLAYVVDEPTYTRAIHNTGSFLSEWNGSVTGGVTLVRATQSDTTITAGAALVREVPGVAFLPAHNRTIFDLSESYGKLANPVIPQTVPASPVSIVKTNIFHTDAEFDRYFSPRLYVLADTAFDHNFAQGLQLQQIYGAGLGYTAIKGPTQQLDLKGEIHYEKQKFIGDVGNQNLIGATFGESYRRNLPLKLVFTESGTVDPAFNNSNAYSAHAQAALAIPAYKRLSFSVSGADDYLHNPPIGYKNNSVQFVTGVTYSIH